MFFHLSITHYAPVLLRFRFGFGAGKIGGSYDGIYYGFPAPPYCDVWGFEILCEVGDWFWVRDIFFPILIAEKSRDSASIAALSDRALRRGTFV